MSQAGPGNPIGPFPHAEAKPAAPVTPVAIPAGSGRMEYLRSFNYIFENPNWLMNVVWGFLCQLAGQFIPVVPALVFMGYQYEVIEELHKNGGRRYPDFDINRFADYLGRSVWPFLVTLILMVFVMPIMMVVGFGMMMLMVGVGASAGEDVAPVVIIFGVFLTMVVVFLLLALFSTIMTPMVLRAGLAQDFAAGFDFGWATDFMRKVWLETVLAMLFMLFSVLGLAMVTCGLALIVVGPMLPFVSSHLCYQLYALYLARGGTPIPLKPRMPPMAPAYMPPPQY
jgi:hypothetical protein